MEEEEGGTRIVAIEHCSVLAPSFALSFLVQAELARLLMDARIFDLFHIVVRIDTIAGTDIVSTIYQLATCRLIAAFLCPFLVVASCSPQWFWIIALLFTTTTTTTTSLLLQWHS